MEYRDRTATWTPDGTVELYMTHKRDFDSCLTRLRKTGVEPREVKDLQPGYIILLAPEQVRDFPSIIAPQRHHKLSEEERHARSLRMLRVRAVA